MPLSFAKYTALGNDFVVVDTADAGGVSPALAQKLCDRHFGIGADGVLLLSPSERAVAELVILNADGSRPEMCGNGLRCVALYLERTRRPGARFSVGTDAGVLDCQVTDHGAERWVSISLGRAEALGVLEVPAASGIDRYHRVRIGNPHAVLFEHAYDSSAIDELGPAVSGCIQGGANVEFTRLTGPRSLDVIVWERGVGRTLACGTGAGAVVAAAARLGKVPYDEPVRVNLPGGTLEVVVDRADLHVTLRGPARHVFDGSLPDAFVEN